MLVINNSSDDKTKEIALQNGARVEDERKKGYGNSIRCGIEKAKGQYIIMGDADNSYNFLEINDIYSLLLKGKDLVIGNRYHNMEKDSMKFLHRYLGTPVLNFLINLKYNSNIKDVNCGLRGFKKNKIQKLNLSSEGMELASEMIIKAIKNKQDIEQVNINFYRDSRDGKGHLKSIKDGIRHLRVIFNN